MSTHFPTRAVASPADLLDRWQAHRRAHGETMLDADRETPVDAPVTQVLPHRPSGDDAGRAVLAALATQVDELDGLDGLGKSLPVETATAPEDPAPPALGAAAGTTTPDPSETEVEAVSPRASAPLRVAAPVPAADGRPAVVPAAVPPVATAPALVLFSPRRGARRILTVLLLVAVAVLAVAGLLAWQARTTTSYAVAGGLAVLAAALRSARGRATGTQVTIENGVLQVVQGSGVHRFPLTGTYPPIDVVGSPGDRGWKVLIHRKSMAPYAVTRSMVDPREFTDAIRRFRPDA